MLHVAPTEPPQHIAMSTVSSQEAEIQWAPPNEADRNGIIISYEVDITSVQASINYKINSSTTSLILRDLLPFTTYSYRVAARTSAGLGPFSTPITFLTDEAGKQ